MVTTFPRHSRRFTICVAFLFGMAAGATSYAQSREGRFLAKEDILLFGLGLKVEPAQQTVPKDIATIVSTMFVAPQLPGNLPPFAADAEVRGTLRGPTFPTPVELIVQPNTPFNIPPLTVAGKHTLDNIRLISNGDVVLRGIPESVVIDVIDRLLITEVTARPLTAAEIREKGLVFDASSYQAYNFAAAFAIEDRKVPINFTVVLPSLQGAEDVGHSGVLLPGIGSQPGLPSLQTVIPDTLKRLQTQIPNLNVQGFTLKVPQIAGQNFFVPPIPGVVVIPGDIGFLNQFFSVMLMVGNVAPAGSNLVVTDLKAEIVLPAGVDTVVGSPDDPLRMGRTDRGEVLRVQPVVRPGPDGALGTADDEPAIEPGDTGNAEFLVEGRREGSHIVEMEITGTLIGLPIGPVTVRGRAAGAVLVRNPTFTLTFTHPEIVTAGEAYTLDVSVTNTSASPANFVSLNLYPRVVSGATIIGEPTREIETIAPGDSQSVSFDLIAKVSGKVTAATLDSNENVTGRFALKTSVGELGVPLSPDSLVLPKEAASLPVDLRTAAIALLGKAYAVATAPGAALPKDVQRFSKKLIWDRAFEIASAGLRVTLHEPARDSATHLLMDFMGSNYSRLGEAARTPEDLAFARSDFAGFDDLRRRSIRGDVFGQSVAALMKDDLISAGPSAFHRDIAEKISYRPGHISILVSGPRPPPFSVSIVDAAGRRLGGRTETGKIIKEIPFGDFLQFTEADGAVLAELALIASPEAGDFKIRLERVPGIAATEPYSLSVVVPDAQGTLRQLVFDNVSSTQLPALSFGASDPFRFSVEVVGLVSGDPVVPAGSVIVDPPPSIIAAVQQISADQVCVDAGKTLGLWAPGRILAVLFSEEVTAQTVQDKFNAHDITNYLADGNQIVGVALQPGGRIAYLALRDPVGPFVARTLTIQAVTDLRGQAMASQTTPIHITAADHAGVVSGRVMRADGTPVPFASMRLFYGCPLPDGGVQWVGISSKSADADGKYSWDYVLRAPRLLAVDPETEEFRELQFSVARNGQRLNVDVVLLGRGTLEGRTLGENGQPLKDTAVKVTSLTDHSQYAATSDADGRFTVVRVPVGNIFVEAVNTEAVAQISISESIPFAGATTKRDFVLLKADSPQTITLKKGTIKGYVLRGEGTGTMAGLPIVVIYQGGSQAGVGCPGVFAGECAVALATTDSDGAFIVPGVPAGHLRVETFDQATLQEGNASLDLAADAIATVNVVISGGLGSVKGVVLDPNGVGVAGARVGGGLSLVTTDAAGQFTLPDVPLGKREIVAVSDTLASEGRVSVDITRVGEQVPATIVLDSVGAVAGTTFLRDGVTPVPGIAVYLYKLPIQHGMIEIVGQATSDDNGHYQLEAIPLGQYRLTAFTSDFSDGNLEHVVVKFNNQKVKADVKFRGGSRGSVTGTVLDASNTPVKARVSLSGDQVVVAGGRVVVDFQYVQNFQIVDTDFSSGTFSMSGLWPGGFIIRAAGQFSPDPISLELTMPAPTVDLNVTLKLQPTSQVTGKILNPDGTPVGEGVIVKYKSDEFKTFCAETTAGEMSCTTIPQGVQEAIAVTDDTGTFLFAVVNAGTYTLTASENADFTGRTARLRGSVRAGEKADVELRLLGMADLVVKVFASDAHTLIPGARVHVQQIDYPNKSVVLFSGQSGDELGIARFAGGDAFTEGAFVLSAVGTQTGGFAGVASGKIVSDGVTVTLNLYLASATGSVHGVVRRPDGSPAPFAEVVISNGDGAIGFNVTDSAGNYSQDLIPLGPFTVDAFDAATAGHGATTGQIFLAGQDVPANIIEDAPAVVTGRLVESGTLAPLKGWRISFSQVTASGRSVSLTTTSSVDGGFSFPGAAVGTFELRAANENVSGEADAAGEITQPGQAVDIPLIVSILRPSFGRIEGVVSYANGAPVPNARVCRGFCEPGDFSITAAADGTFAFEQMPLGRALISATPQTGVELGSTVVSVDFDGDVVPARIVLAGISQITGTVVFNGVPSPFAKVSLLGNPNVRREGFADQNGRFSFPDVSARSFTITAAAAPGFTNKGVVSERLNPGESREVLVVLEPTGALTGRVLLESTGNPAAGITAEVVIGGRHFFAETQGDGTFAFETLPLGNFTLALEDSIGTGVATRTGTLIGILALPDITLDASAPIVAQMSPAPSATGIAKNATIRLVMSEPIDPATLNTTNVALSAPAGAAVPGSVVLSDGDTAITFTPLGGLNEQTKYSIRVSGLKDRVGHSMRAEFVGGFTTADTIAPTTLEISPAAGTIGSSIFSPVRIAFNEPIDPVRFRGLPTLTLSSPAGVVAGRLDFLFGNTVVVFTPNLPLAPGTTYHVLAPAAADVSANIQPQAFDYSFTTTTGAAPVILQLSTGGNGSVIENTVTSVQATIGAFDVAFVDFFLNDVFAAAVRAPFTFNFQAVPGLGAPGNQIKVSAIATDTSGVRGPPIAAFVAILPDLPPTATILLPPALTSAANGEHVPLSVRATDDVGVVQMTFKALTGKPLDAATRAITPPVNDRTESFGFTVPVDAVPGSSIVVQGSATDTKGQIVAAAPVTVTVRDSVAPVVTITGATSGTQVRPGQQTTVVVSIQDAGGIRAVTFKAAGVATLTQTRVIDPPQTSIVTSFSVTVPSGARPPQSLTLDATAEDRAGNVGSAARVILPVGDGVAPTITGLRTATGSLQIVPGGTAIVVVDAEDDLGISQIKLEGQGAFIVSDAKAIAPPLGAATTSFTIQVPANAVDGAVLNLLATAVDLAGNSSAPAALALSVTSLPTVTFGPSVIVNAGETKVLALQVSGPAPPNGLRIDFSSTAAIATATPFVIIGAGQSEATITVRGESGGLTFVTALIQNVARGSASVTVEGGIVRGTIRDLQFAPVAGARIAITSGLTTVTTESDSDGRYKVVGVPGPFVTVKVLKDIDASTRLLGFATGFMNSTNGFIDLDMVLFVAGSIGGPVWLDDGVTPAGDGVKVELFAANNLSEPLSTTFTVDGAYEFPLVALGKYTIDVSDTAGHRGRASAEIASSGQEVTVPVAFLGRGSITVNVRDAAGNPVSGALVTVLGSSIFGSAPPISGTAISGTITVPNMLIGSFTVQATDPLTNLGASASGTLTAAQPNVTVVLTLASFAGLQGTVYRSDGTTTVSGATVSVFGNIQTVTDTQGRYAFTLLPLGTSPIQAREPATHGIGLGSVTLDQQGQTKTVDITFFAQGTLVVTVANASGVPVPGAALIVDAVGPAADTLFAETDATGVAVVNNVIAGSFTVRALSGILRGSTTGTLAPGEQKPVLVSLQPTASIQGIVRAPNDAPVTEGFVTVGSESGGVTVPIAPDGTFRADGLIFGTYTVTARDAQNRLRARVRDIVLTVPNQVAQTSLKFVGLGGVVGRVVNPDGSSAIGLSVQVRGLNPEFNAFRSSSTNAGGFYAVSDIPVGAFTVSVANPVLQLRGEAAGTITADGDTETHDILLQSNLVDLPISKWDANNFKFDLQRNGSILTGTNDVFAATAGTATLGGSRLDIIAGGTAVGFAGASVGAEEDRKREVAVHQDNVGGLSITRKVFVPSAGYFARYLELLTNPAEVPVSVGVRVSSSIHGGDPAPAMMATSSGDNHLDLTDPSAPDRWLVIDDGIAGDPFLVQGVPATAFAFDGPNAAVRAVSASFAPVTGGPGAVPHDLAIQWNVTIPPGATIALLHFAVQQTSRPGAQAAAERLLQLPPEALDGLSSDEVAQVQNFAAPLDGVSQLAALPALTGAITGRVLASDLSTPVAGVPVRFQSSGLLFNRTFQTTSAADGSFSFASTFTEQGTSRAIPAGSFTLRADHPSLGALAAAPAAAGDFAANSLLAQQDVVFTNTGLARGVVRLNGAPLAGATVAASGVVNGSSVSFSTQTSATGTYAFALLPAGTFAVTATSVQAGVTVRADSVALVAGGQVVATDLNIDTIAPTVSITSPAAGAQIDPRNPLSVSVQATDAGGVNQIAFAAAGSATAAAIRPIVPAVSPRTELFEVTFADLPPTGGTLTLTATAQDAAGNNATATPVVVAVRDVVAPVIVSVSPAAGSVGVDVGGAAVVRFSEAIDRSTVTTASLRVTRNGTVVPAVITFADLDRTAALSPVSALTPNTNYIVEVTAGVTDTAGNPVAAPATFPFKTQSPDTTSPRVLRVVPAAGAVNVPVGSDLRVTFTEPIDPATLTPASMRVTINASPVAGRLSLLDGNTTARFAPDAALPFDAIVVLELTSSITDLFENPLVDGAGAPLGSPLTFTFLTGTFGITNPINGSDVLENTALTLEAQASSSLNLASLTFTVNGQALTPDVSAPFSTVYTVGPAAVTPTLTIRATGRDGNGSVVAEDQVVVPVAFGLRIGPRLLGTPTDGTSILRLSLGAGLPDDLNVQLSAVDPSVATVPDSAVIPAGETEVHVVVGGASTGATTIAATSSRGNAWSIASVSPLVARTLSTDAMPVGVVVIPTRLLGKVFAAVNGQTSITVPILGSPAVVDTAVSVTSTNGAVASVAGAVSIAAGSQSATLTIAGGIAGTATLTIRAGADFGQLTIVVGTPPSGSIPPILARPAGIVVVPAPSAGRLYTAPAGQSTFNVRLLSSPAAADTPVSVSSSDAAIASVANPGMVPVGSDSVAVTVTTGVQGTATLVFRAGAETREVTVVVGTPAAGTVPPILARPAGIVLLAAPSAGRLFTGVAAQSVLTLRMLSAAAATATPVSFSTSNADVASVTGPVVIAAGATAASVTVVAGIAGTATLTFTAAGETRELTVVVGTPPPGSVPPVLARPVGVVMIPQRQLGSVFSAIGAQPSVNLTLLSSPAAAAVPVVVTSSDPNVATVNGGVVIPVGSRVANLNIVTGSQGVATLTLQAGSELAQIYVVVGTPPASHLPLIVAPIVGVSVKQ